MPLDHRCRFDQDQGVEDLRPHSVQDHPEESVGGEEPKPSSTLPRQDAHLMSEGDEPNEPAAANTKRKQGYEDGKNCAAIICDCWEVPILSQFSEF
jgi:hypothetical protein